MDILERYLGYEAWTLRYFIKRCYEVSPAQLHQSFDVGPGSVHATLAHIIGNLETWTDLMRERPVRHLPAPATVDAYLERFDAAQADFAELARELTARDCLDDVYLDVLDVPATSKTFGGTLLHVLTHTTVHRWEIQHMLQRLGLANLIEGDVLGWEQRTQQSMPDLQLLRPGHASALLAFERENRAYFAAVVPDRGDEFFTEFDTRYAQLLAWQAEGTDYFHLLMTEGGEVVGRVNLVEVADGSAELGYRIAQKAAGQGLATAAVRKVRELAATAYGLTRLRARVTLDNPASRKVLEHNGFVAVGELTLNGKPAVSYICKLR